MDDTNHSGNKKNKLNLFKIVSDISYTQNIV